VVTTRPSTSPPPRVRWLIRLGASLSRWQRPTVPTPNLEPAIAAQELVAWSEDDGRWNTRSVRDWHSLLDDVHESWSRLGPRLTDAVDVSNHLAALRKVRAAKTLSAVEHRSEVERAARALALALDRPGTLIAAADDLFAAAQRSRHPESLDDEARWHLAILASVGERHGHDWAVVAERMRRALEATRSLGVEQSIEAVRRTLRAPPGRGRSIVWLAVDHAETWGPSPNPAIQLFNGDWLLAVLRNWDGPRADVPAELAADPERLPKACPRFDEDAAPDAQLPVTFARIDLGEGPTVGVRDRARDTLELLIARASTRQGGTNWKISGVCLHFVDGELIFECSGPIGDPDIYNRLTRQDVLQDPTGETIREESERLRAHIPVSDGTLHAALELARWLTVARGSSPPGRLVLSGRILEQVANWAAVSVPTLVEDYLSLAWAWNQIAGILSHAGASAVLRLRGADDGSSSDEDRERFLEVHSDVIDDRSARGRPRARPWQALLRLDWLIEQHPATTEIGDYLREIHQRLADGPAAAAWIDELRHELRVRNARAVRTRNAIVHGGPLVTAVAETVVGVQDALSAQALEWVISGLAAESALSEVFADHRNRYTIAIERLLSKGDPTIELQAAVVT
jgi:hypothetical protein